MQSKVKSVKSGHAPQHVKNTPMLQVQFVMNYTVLVLN